MTEELLLWFVGTLAKVAAEGLARLDLWCAQKFGRPLSGRLNKLEIQPLFHGNTRDQEQI